MKVPLANPGLKALNSLLLIDHQSKCLPLNLNLTLSNKILFNRILPVQFFPLNRLLNRLPPNLLPIPLNH